MDIELLEIRDFLATCHPFDQLPQDELDRLPRFLELTYLRREREVYSPHSLNEYLYIIRSGAVEIRDEQNHLLSQLGEGDSFGARSLLRGHTLYRVNTLEDTLFYKLPSHRFIKLCESYENIAFYFHADIAQRLHNAVTSPVADHQHSEGLMTQKISNIMNASWIGLPGDTSIQTAARAMTEQKASAILVIDNERLVGIVTDRDLCSRCLAVNLDSNSPIKQIMSSTPMTIDHEDFAATALITMSRHNIHHLPVVNRHQVMGIVSVTDLMQNQSTSPVYLVSDIYRHTTINQLADTSRLLPRVMLNLVNSDASADSIGRMISFIGEAITTRLIQLAEEKLGPPPVPYCWLNFGSLARHEQNAVSDQDNGLVMSDDYEAERHDSYFLQLATFVSDGLSACGYEYCPGDIMATNTHWRQPLSQWKKYFSQWINKPEPKALMHASIFFDMRGIHGEFNLVAELKQHINSMAQSNSIFLAHLAGNALHMSPPLGFFRRFVLVHDGKHDNTLDLKHNGVVPIIDLARIYALAKGIDAVNTRQRLLAAAGQGDVSTSGADDLMDALELIGRVRCHHQASLIAADKPIDNFVSPDALSNLERNQLKSAFEIVRTMQEALGQRFQAGRF